MGTVRSKDGTTIAFDQSGTGPALILVGGAFQYRAIDERTAKLASLLAARFTVFHYDRRGRGESGDTAPYATAREIEDLDALISAAGGAVFVFGMSSGAALALDAAAQGLSIKKLAVYEPPFIVDDARPPLPEDYAAHLTALAASGRRGDAIAYFLTRGVGVPAEAVEQMRQAPVWPAFEAIAHTLAYDGALVSSTGAGKPLSADRWASGTIPTLVVDGGASSAWMRNAARALADVLPNAQRATLEGQQHDAAPELLAPVLEAFFINE